MSRKKVRHLQKDKPVIGSNPLIPESLQLLVQKRIGGSVNFRGIHFQLLYAIYILLTKLSEENNSVLVKMEGVEDIDVYLDDASELIQVKTSKNNIDAGNLWNMNVLQNFMEAFKANPSLSFIMVHNTTIAKGKIEEFGSGNISTETLNFWEQKFKQHGSVIPRNDLSKFLSQVVLKATNENYLSKEISHILLEKFNINNGTESSFIQALFYFVFDASKNRHTLTGASLATLIQSVKDSFSRFPDNPAIKHSWISPVSYQIHENETDFGYYDGKAARPIDIARGLPVHRPDWEKAIETSILKYDITVIKSSSGQGKSTLAWQMGYLLSKKSFAIYQLNSCVNYNEASAITDFIDSRLSVGQTPLVIIDGLNQNLSAWNELAKQIREKPVRLLITSREEDWNRYGDELSPVIINIIDIKVTMPEAAAIYSEIQKNKKLHTDITSWEPAWEKVKDRGLMIEYIYLLTKGQMIAERLSSQIHNIKKETGNVAKLEILRLIALADTLHIKLQTQRLTDHITQYYSFETDRNEVYRQLEKEYYLRFDNKYVEGLHPVRSEHLVGILHSHTPIQGSLLSILKIIEEKYVYDFFIEAPLIFDFSQNDDFYKSAAAIVAGKTIPEMVYAIDGLMHIEPYNYWKINRLAFDSAFKSGGLELFVYETVPFIKFSNLQSLAESMGAENGSNIFYLLDQKKQLSNYNFKNSILVKFATHLKTELSKRGTIESPEGVAFLYKWFKQMGITFPDIIEVNQEKLLYFLESKDIQESSELFHFYSILNPDSYRAFAQNNLDQIIGYIKWKTNTLTIEEKGSDIHINYLLDNNVEMANEYSVYRINIVHAFLPFYEHYCTEAIVMPFPNKEIYKVVLDNSRKKMKPKVLGDDFDVHINQIWSRTILDQYGASSSYEWQKKHIQFREHCIELIKKCTRLLESHLEKNSSNISSLTKEVISKAKVFFELGNSLPKHPSKSKKYFDKKLFAKEQSDISEWILSFRNFINQLGGLIIPKNDRDRQLPVINLQSAVCRLPEMQKSYNQVADTTCRYFEINTICVEEAKWLTRLLHTVQFYVAQVKQKFTGTIVVASKSITEWKQLESKRRLTELHGILSEFESDSFFKFYPPKQIIEQGNLNYAVIGVWGCDISIEQDLWDLSTGLIDLVKTDIHFFTFVWVNDENQAIGAMRVGKEYFERFQQLLDTGDVREGELGNPLPQIPDGKMIETLNGITLKTVEPNKQDSAFFNIMMDIWKLLEHRKRLNAEILPEKKWLEEAEKEYSNSILEYSFEAVHSDTPESPIGKAFIDSILSNKINLSTDEIYRLMMERAIQINSLQ